MQKLLERSTESEKVRIVIVGPSKPQWKIPEKYERMKEKIREILLLYISSLENPRLKENLIVVTGHCPVGEEKWYNLDRGKWELAFFQERYEGFKGPVKYEINGKVYTSIKVYTEGGVDTEAEIIAHQLGLKTEIYPAVCTYKESIGHSIESCKIHYRMYPDANGYRNHFWEFHYKPRNVQMAKVGNVFYVLAPYQAGRKCMHHTKDDFPLPPHPQNGGCYTAKTGKGFGKETQLLVIT